LNLRITPKKAFPTTWLYKINILCFIEDNRAKCGAETYNVAFVTHENAELRNQIDVGSSVPPESPLMNPETGRLSATHVSKVMKVAESQNGIYKQHDLLKPLIFILHPYNT